MMPCACDPLGNADVVFLVDESVDSRQADYLTNVHKVMKHTINAFYESSQSTNMDESLRFGLLKYSLKTKIVFDLKSYGRLHKVYSELKKLILNNGKQSDLKLALNFVKSKIMPQTRPGAPLFIYIITDGFGNQMPAVRLLTDYLKSHNVQINALLLTSSEKAYDSNFFKQLVSPPSSLHLVELKTDSDQFSRNLSRIADTFCKKECTPANQTFIKTCNERGEAVQVTIHRYLKNCRCMTQQTDKIVRCRCTKKYNTKTCFGDDVMVHHYHYERLLDGECLPQRRDVHKKLACKNPKVYKAGCDYLTCQQRVTVVTYVAQRCRCKRFVQVKHETCCCKGDRTTSYAGCKHNDLKVFEEKIVDPKVNTGSCVQRVRYYFQPITCPIKPLITRHSCRRYDPKAAKQGEDGIVKVDPALIYRFVEKIEWKTQDCYCRRHYGSYFEACGCDESVVFNDSMRIKQKCDPQSGVIVTYRQKVRLEIVGVPIEYTKLNRLNKLSDAVCRTHYVMESARKIICPDTKTLVGPCELAKDGRAYKTVKIHKWKQHNCVCQNLPPEIMEKQLCGCLRFRLQKKCVSSKPEGPMNKLQVYFIREELHTVKLPSGQYKNECKVEQTMKEEIIQCPKNTLRYSPCKKGTLVVTMKVYKIDNCKCQESIQRLQVRCKVPKKSASVEHAKSIPTNQMPHVRQPVADCIDLLSTEECVQQSRSPDNICRTSNTVSDLLCRRTCRRCIDCELNNIKYELTDKNYLCLDNIQGFLSGFLIKSMESTLASCKLACAKHTGCLSFTYSIPTSKMGYKTAKCMLYGIYPITVEKYLQQEKKRQPQQPTDSPSQQSEKPFDQVFSSASTETCLTFRKICKITCLKPQTKEISKCECKVYKSYYGNPLKSPKFKSSLHCFKNISVEYYIQLQSGVCQKQNWQGYTPCSNPRYRDLHIRDQVNCDNMNPTLWCEAQLAADERKCKDDVFSQVCSKTCGLCTCHGVNVFKGKCKSTGQRTDTHITYKSHPVHRICYVEMKTYLKTCEYCPVGSYEFVHKCDKQSDSRIVNQITAKLIQIPSNIDGKPQIKCSVQTKNYKFRCGNCLAAYSDKHSLSPCKRVASSSVPYQINLTTEYVINEGGCCKTRRTQRQFNCANCPPLKVKRTSCYNGQRLKHIMFFIRPWVSSSVQPNECIRKIITRREKCTADYHTSEGECRDILSHKDCKVIKQSGGCQISSYEARNLCAKTCCPPTRRWISECKQNFRYQRTITFKFVNGTCVRQEKIGKQRCGCPQPINRIYCDGNGRWVKCNTQYVYNPKTHVCRLLKHCVRWYDECPRPTNRIVSQCSAKTQFKHVIQYVNFVRNETSCKCVAVVKNEWTEFCGCDHLNRKVYQCRDNIIPTIGYWKYELVKGDCIPKRMKYSKRLNCPKPTVQNYPCDNDPKSPNRGYKVSKIQHFVGQNCSCIPKVKVERKICNCSLIHPQVVSKRCENNNLLLMRRRFSTLMRDKCLHSEAVYKKPINCKPLKRINVGKCQIGPDSIWTQKIDELILTAVNCQCVWRVKHSEKKICKCPNPVKKQRCINNGQQLMHIITTFNLEGDKCKASQQEIEVDPCAHIRKDFSRRPLFHIGKCDPTTCKAKRSDYRFSVKNCQCQILQKVTDEICCCPKPLKKQPVCNHQKNIIVQKQTHFSLITPTNNTQSFKSYCQPKSSQISIQVKCGQKFQRIRVKPCDGEFHHITVLKPIVENCTCRQKILQNLKIRCGCPTAVRHIPGACINQWALHKWVGLKSVATGGENPYQVTEKSCKPEILEQRRIRCACPPVQVFKKCFKHNLLSIQRVNYKLNQRLNNCEMYKTKEFKRLICPKTQITQTPCGSKLENYEQHEVVKLWYADQCRCLLKVIKKKWVCNCHARYPKHVVKKCLPNGYQLLSLKTTWHNQGRRCVNKTERQVEQIKCPTNLKIIRGQCDKDRTGRLPLIYLQQRPKNCQCIWQRLTDIEVKKLKLKTSEACRCHRNFMVKRCQPSEFNNTAHLIRMYFKYAIQQGECHIYRKVEKKPIVCQRGNRIERSQCDPITNERIETRIDTYLDGCQCHQKLFKRRCRCSCPKPKNNSVCQSRDGLLRKIKVVHEFTEDQCTCKAKYYVQSSRVRCNEPPKLIKIGQCHKLPQNESEYVNKNDLYRNIFWMKLHRVGCQCQYKRFMEQIPCYLGKPEYDKRCNPKTGIETVRQKLPFVENCILRYRVNVQYRKCNCPAPVTKRRCIQTNSEQFVLETVSTKWKLSDSKPICSRLDTIINRVPVDCSEEYVNKSDKCVLNLGRHAFVRVDQVTTFHADGCRCIENNVRQEFTVCKCIRPHKEKSCLYSEGILTYQNVHYEVSGDKSRCIPRRTRQVFKVACSPIGPQYKGRTQCDPKTGNFYHLYEESKRVGCKCVKNELRIPGKCKCPKPTTEMRCSMQNIQQLNTTTYKLSSKGTCTKSEKLQYKYIKCPIPDELLQESPNYKAEQSGFTIKHIHKCNSAGTCSRVVREYKIYTDNKCKCIIDKRQYKEACCCPTEKDVNQFQLSSNLSQQVSFSKRCDANKGELLTDTIKWNLEHGRCWPVLHRTVQPIICSRKESFKPIGFCRSGQQKHLHQREIRVGCECRLDKRVVMMPCACDPLGNADVVFLVDESVDSRQADYLTNVHKVMKHTINAFYESSQSTNMDESLRFGLLKYSLKTKIVFDLKSYGRLHEVYSELKKLILNNGKQSDLKLALNFVKSKTQQTDKIVRCRCTKKYNTKTCFGDDVMVHHYHYERLLDGECLPQRRDVHKKLACKNPKVYKAGCDYLTCQQRVTVVTYVAQRCRCKRFVQVKHETCCCKGDRTTSYAGCKHNDLKVFEEKIVDPKVNTGSCVQRVRYYFQPITCPIKPLITRHSCRRYDPKAAKQGEDGIVKVDPALIYRFVEKIEWKTQDCYCRRHYGSYFEACGCDESVVFNDSMRIKQKCDPQSGVIVTYRQKVRLEIVGVPIEYTKLNRLNKLSDAVCRTHYVMESARKIICPDTKTLVGPCELAKDGRAYKTVKIHKWKQHNCVCQNLPPEIMEKQLCGCLRFRLQKKCVSSKPEGPMNKLQVYFIREELHTVKLPSGQYKNECKVEQTMKEEIIQCPKNTLRYSPCKKGTLVVTMKVYKIDNCKCQESIQRLQVRCKVPKKSASVEHAKSIPTNQMPHVRQPVADCIDLLSTEECVQQSRPPDNICRTSNTVSALLCRRTCRRCIDCELNNIKYELTDKNYLCLDNIQGFLSGFLIKSMESTLASCKLACAKHTGCLSFTYSILTSKMGYKTAKCMLYGIYPITVEKYLQQEKKRQPQQPTDSPSQQSEKPFDQVFSSTSTETCLTFRKICKITCLKPQTKEISKCECKVYKSYYGNPLKSPKFKSSLHCFKNISVEYYIQLQSGVCQKQNWQGYTPCSNPRYRDLHIRDQVNCDNMNPTLWCEAQLAADERKCKDDVFSQVCSKTCGLCTCHGVNVFKGKCKSTGQRTDTHITYKSHPVHRICYVEMKTYLKTCEYCPVGSYEFVHNCDKQSDSRIVNQITAKLIQIPSNIDGKPQIKCSVQTKNYKFRCGNCLAAYSDKHSISPCKRVASSSVPYQINLTTEYVIYEGGCCKTRRTQRQFNCANCPPLKVKRTSCYNGQRLKHIMFFIRPWVSSSVQPNECIRKIITRREKCTADYHTSEGECRDILSHKDCKVIKQSGGCQISSYEARNLCAKTCRFCK
ncbi:unnamed protein product [Trichobilharzia szidati]|nr:unnamed protein product [Trichobilharzia szidati]